MRKIFTTSDTKNHPPEDVRVSVKNEEKSPIVKSLASHFQKWSPQFLNETKEVNA